MLTQCLREFFASLKRSTPVSQVSEVVASFDFLFCTNRLDTCLRRATLYPAELRVRERSFSRLARGRQRPNRGCFGLDWRGVALFQATVTRSNRVGCARKARAERAGTVAGSISSLGALEMIQSLARCPGVQLKFTTFPNAQSEYSTNCL